MIQNLARFVQSLIVRSHKTIVCIDIDEPFISGRSGTTYLLESAVLIDLLINRDGVGNEPPPTDEVRKEYTLFSIP